ncbi:hypothetical protein CHS0354_034880, partial [Potamilus streckersoni]
MTTGHTSMGHQKDTKQEGGKRNNYKKTQIRPSRKFSIRKTQTGRTTSIAIMKRCINFHRLYHKINNLSAVTRKSSQS